MTSQEATIRELSPRVAVIIVSWNNKNILPGCIQSVRDQSYAEVDAYLIDNDSKDGTFDFISSEFPEINLIAGGKNLGFAKGNNVAIKYALQRHHDYQYFVLLNTDARLDPTWIEKMVAFAKFKPTGAIFQSVTLDYYNPSIIDSTHIYISKNGQGTQGNWRNPLMGYLGPIRVFGVNAAAAMISRAFLDAQPLKSIFDERMFMYLEDVDLSARATIMGWDNYLVPDAKAYHMGSVSSGKNPGFSLYMTFRNNSAMLIKNLPPSLLVRMLPGIIRGDYYTIKHLMLRGKSRAASKVVTGRLIGLLRLPLYISDARVMARHHLINKKYLYALLSKGHI